MLTAVDVTCTIPPVEISVYVSVPGDNIVPEVKVLTPLAFGAPTINQAASKLNLTTEPKSDDSAIPVGS